MANEVLSLADILSLDEMRALMDSDISTEIIIESFLKNPSIQKMEYKKEENKFYITFDDGDISTVRLFFSQSKNDS